MSLTDLAEGELARSGLRLAFASELEARYRLDTAAERSRELRKILQIGTFLYFGIGVIMKLAGVTHASWRDCLLQLVGVSAVVLIASDFFRPKTVYVLRETTVLGCCLAASLAAILVTYGKPETTQDLIIAALPANFVLMFVRLKFPFAAGFALVTFGSYTATILLRPAMALQHQMFLIAFMAILCLPALVGVHALEQASRRNYLHGLLQRLHIEDLAVKNSTLALLSLTDPLTQIANRRRLDTELRAFCADEAQSGALLLIDVDRFKTLNDKYGHRAGDICLQQVAERFSARLRQCDLLARFGGEEFAVLLPRAGVSDAVNVAEGLRAAIQARPFVIEGTQLSITVSIGIAVLSSDMAPETLIEAADSALYSAKNAGRNQVRVHRARVTPGLGAKPP
jgi:diguanylate cyclase (GGDEF)-like protein